MTKNLTKSITPKPKLSEPDLEYIAWHEGRRVVVCYGKKEGYNIAETLKKENPIGYINFIIAPTSLPLGKYAPKDGVLDNEIKESHCIVVLLDINGFLKSEKAKKEFRIILEYQKGRYIPIFLKENEKDQIIKKVKEEFGVDLSEIQYATWKGSREFLTNLYEDIKKIVIH